MHITVLSLFPAILEAYFNCSIMARAVQNGIIDYKLVDIRDFADNKHRLCDDKPYGGGPGMVMSPAPLAAALDSQMAFTKRVIYPTPSGRRFTQAETQRLSESSELLFICGRYEGIDQRIIDLYVDDELCIGDYVISSGEIAAMVIIDSVYRLVEGVINTESLSEESFQQSLLEYPHYTRPEVFRGMKVPRILLEGHHARIQAWRDEQRRKKTLRNRPDLLEYFDYYR